MRKNKVLDIISQLLELSDEELEKLNEILAESELELVKKVTGL